MAAPKKVETPDEAEDWLVTFADAITLLMAFFVMLLTFSEFDIPAYEELASAVAANIGGKNTQSTTQSLKIDAQDLVYEMQADQVVTVGADEKGVTIELQSNAFFLPGSADIAPAAIPVLKKLAERPSPLRITNSTMLSSKATRTTGRSTHPNSPRTGNCHPAVHQPSSECSK